MAWDGTELARTSRTARTESEKAYLISTTTRPRLRTRLSTTKTPSSLHTATLIATQTCALILTLSNEIRSEGNCSQGRHFVKLWQVKIANY